LLAAAATRTRFWVYSGMLALTDSALAPHCFGATAPGPTAVARLNSSPPCCRDGCTESILLAHGFTVEQIVELDHAVTAVLGSQRWNLTHVSLETIYCPK